MAIIDIDLDLAAGFCKQAAATPDAIALEDKNQTYTYAELDDITGKLANSLLNHGVGRDDPVGVLMSKSADYVIACLAALRAGGAFLVLELAYPPKMLGDVIDDARPTAILTKREHVGRVKADVPLIIMDEAQSNSHGSKSASITKDDYDLEKLAFISYSSGTTGRPKGIANPHRAAVRSYDLRFKLSDLQPGDRVACNVFFIWEILRPLLRGATTFCIPDEASYDPVALVDLLSSRNITETLMTPTLLATILSRHARLGERLPELRTLWLNGEVVTTDLVLRAMKALPNTRLLNCYSASETHEIACGDIKEMLNTEQPYCPVGPPVAPEYTYVLDENMKRVDVGVSGELFIGGELLARGYLNLEETTAKAFLPDPFTGTPGARMYRTGDMARVLESGCLEITGRVGAMIKLRGYSVVPGTVENAIVKNLAVKQCAVVPRGDGVERQLVAYIVHDQDANDDRTVVSIDDAGYCPKGRRALAEHLAHYMIPAVWVELDVLPTHEVSGKVDLKSLPAPPEPGAPTTNGKAKVDNNTKIKASQIVELWAASLKIPVSAVTEEHSFFDLGGHSLTLADLSSRLAKTFGFAVPLGSLAGDPTIKGHVKAVTDARDGYTANIQADLPASLRADSVLAADIQPKNTVMQPLSKAKTVLLTGVTGFLGAFLLSSLLDKTEANIICVVRFPEILDDQCSAGMARLRKNLTELGLWNDAVIDRVEILPANLSRKRLGLSPDQFEELASRVEVIVHAAATVNLVYPYAALRAPNVGGTREILRLACLAGATLHAVSTNGVLPPSSDGWSEDTIIDVDDVPTKLQDGYSQTKWVAEQLVLEASRRGLPARIYRPGTISGHSKTGATNAWDLLTAIIVESLQIGYAPDIPNWLVEMTPVDFVSTAITTLADHEDMSQQIFHLGDPAPIRANDVFSHLSQLGYSTEKLAFDKWAGLWKQKRGSGRWGEGSFTVDILRSGMPSVDFIQEVTVLNDGKTRPILEGVFNLQRPKIDAKLLQTYSRHFYARGWLPRPPRKADSMATQVKPRGPLAGKVAVITGASSGIGAAVASALAAEGADVALAARRVEVLDSLKSKITSTSGVKVLAQATDVTDRNQVEALIKATEETLGPVDILVACAGVMYFTMMKNVHVDEWERTVDVNCKGLLHSLSSTVPSMLSRGKGHIVAISSDAGRKVFPGLGVYSASKMFVEGTLQALRVENAGSGLRVTSVQPGNTATDLLGMSTDQEAVKEYGEPSGAKILDAKDVAEAIVYAVTRPEHVAVNEVLIEPRDEPI
ncbi:putative NRPS-like protein biosynthetic cluster [Gnomoniopsis sp. IMI 355080]|nr:putative NRPS-like protein biosynthetic cluster [Gnomoniopsis sp. IMI 355080]